MYIHKQFIKEQIGTDKQAVNDLAFFLLLKAKTSNSVIYNSTTYSAIAKWLKMDRRTVKLKLDRIIARGWCKPSGDHLLLKSINKEYEYRLKENGKPDKKKNSKYFRVKINKKFTLSQIKDIVRTLLIKPHYQKELFKNVKNQMEHFSKKGLKKVWSAAYNIGDKRKLDFLAEKSMVNIPIRLICKAMGVSKSTAHRVVNSLSKDGMILKQSHEPVYRGRTENLKVDKLPYGIYTFNGNVYHKIVTSYAF